MSANWKSVIETETEAKPRWTDGVPYCSEEDCAQYDGKRCRSLGFKPASICEPAVVEMAALCRKAVGE